MSPHLIYVAIDSASIILMWMVAVRLLTLAPRNPSTWIVLAIVFNTTCYIISSRQDYGFYIPPELTVDLGWFYPFANVARNSTAVLFMFLCQRIFRDGKPIPTWMFVLFGVLVFLEEPFARLAGPGWIEANPLLALALEDVIPIAMQTFVIGYAGYLMLEGRQADLIETRRRVRIFLLAVVAVQTVASLLIERFAFQFDLISWEYQYVVHVGFISLGLVFNALCVVYCMRPDILKFVDPATPQPKGAPEPIDTSGGDVERIQEALEQEKIYQRNGLSVNDLAKHLAIPEYRLRKLIHDHMGYRNFNTLLHRYRIDEVAAALRDPAQNATPVLTLALSAGYQSITPFNRAFREEMGMTPTQYRADSQQNR